MDARKILLVIFDGLGDRPLTELGHKTPLEATPKPNLDWFASNGVNGLVDPIAPGVAAGSDTSHLALFGYDPKEVYTGRGPFEAAGVGIDMQPGDIAFRGNFASVDEDLKLTDRRAGRIREGTEELAKALDGLKLGRIKANVREGTEHRVAVVLRGRGLSPKVTDTDPHEIGETIQESKPLESAARVTAKADAAMDALRTHDLVVLHVKAPDLCGHDGKASEKIRVIERMDAMMGHLKAMLSTEVVVALTADHSTPVALKDHSGDPVPLTIFGEGVRVDDVLNFDERSMAHGALGQLRGTDVMNVLLNASNRMEKYGA